MIININMEKNKCKRCSHDWISRIDSPLQCPRCKSYYWNKDKGGERE
jgi:predicted Zn-ribbon and HTH transcriptional regulator